jgi:predicted PurR-regulated permease PerM
MNEFAASRALYRGFLFLVLVIAAVLLFRELTWVMIQLFVAVIIASSTAPIVNALTSSKRALGWRWRPSRALVVIATYLVVGSTILVLGAIVFGAVVAEVETLLQHLPGYAAMLQDQLASVSLSSPLLDRLDSTSVAADVDGFAGWVASLPGDLLGFLRFVSSLLGGALAVLFTLFLALYLTVDSGRLLDYMLVFFPASRQAQARRMAHDIGDRLGQWVIGQLVLCVIIGTGAWLGLRLIGVPYAAMLGLIWALAEFMPGIGPFLSAVPSILLGFLVSPAHGVAAAVFCLAWSQIENNIITPKVMGDAVELHPLIILVSLLVGHELLGLAGALLAIPVAATLAVVVDELHAWRLRCQVEVGTPAGELMAGPTTAPPGVESAS